MNKIDNILTKYFVYALPLLGLTFGLGLWKDPDLLSRSEGFIRHLWDFLGWIVIFWILISLYIFIKMVISSKFRDLTLKKFIGLKERDERESIITGDAAKLSLISTSALSVLLLFMSIMTVNIGKYPEKELFVNDKKHFITIGLNPLLENNNQKPKTAQGIEIFSYSGLPLPMSIVIFLILGWQLITFRYIVKKGLKE